MTIDKLDILVGLRGAADNDLFGEPNPYEMGLRWSKTGSLAFHVYKAVTMNTGGAFAVGSELAINTKYVCHAISGAVC